MGIPLPLILGRSYLNRLPCLVVVESKLVRGKPLEVVVEVVVVVKVEVVVVKAEVVSRKKLKIILSNVS
jgi:hypothetical protein